MCFHIEISNKNRQVDIKYHNEKKILTIFNNVCHKIVTFPSGELQAGSVTFVQLELDISAST